MAATVMMGGLLEGLLLARVNKEPNQQHIFTAKNSPKDRKTGNPLPLKDWGLKDYIDVAHELKWITVSAKDVGVVLTSTIRPTTFYPAEGVADTELLWCPMVASRILYRLGREVAKSILEAAYLGDSPNAGEPPVKLAAPSGKYESQTL